MERLDGKRIIITGGASGMARCLVENFPGLGAKVAFMDVNDEAGEEVSKATGCPYFHCDVSKEDEVNTAVDKAVEYLGGLDVLIHAAAIGPFCPAEFIDFASWKRLFEINVDGTFLTNQAAFRHMAETGGHIINFTSASAFIDSPTQAHYGATKGAVNVWSRGLAREWIPYNIRCNMVAPVIYTPMMQDMFDMMDEEMLEGYKQHMATLNSKGGAGDMIEDFLPVMAFLASDSAKFINGQTISVDGGVMMVR